VALRILNHQEETMEKELAKCRDCGNQVSPQAFQCPRCGAPKPYLSEWTGHGFEWKSGIKVFGWPLIHICFKYRPRPVPARGIVAIGQFGMGIVTIAQFGIGIATVAQLGAGIWIIGQIALAWTGIAQIGFLPGGGFGQAIWP
ncbi:MAG: hypothetical protein ACLFPR_11515, partial [Desulfococcaceae bacterium]